MNLLRYVGKFARSCRRVIDDMKGLRVIDIDHHRQVVEFAYKNNRASFKKTFTQINGQADWVLYLDKRQLWSLAAAIGYANNKNRVRQNKQLIRLEFDEETSSVVKIIEFNMRALNFIYLDKDDISSCCQLAQLHAEHQLIVELSHQQVFFMAYWYGAKIGLPQDA